MQNEHDDFYFFSPFLAKVDAYMYITERQI